MKQNKKPKMNDDQLRFDNEVRKLKLTLGSGAKFYSCGDGPDLPPEVEKEFLDNIEKFETQLQLAKDILVFDFLGRPDFRKEEELSDQEIITELEKVETLMLEKRMVCDKLFEVDDRVFYKFLTEELFYTQTTSICVPAFLKHVIYEEFHPNHKQEIKMMCEDFVNVYMSNEFEEFREFIKMDCKENFNELLVFRRIFEELTIISFEENSLEISGHLATVTFNIAFEGFLSGNRTPINYLGEANFKFKYNDESEFWEFSNIFLPGMRPTLQPRNS